jgi:NADH-quinone oxidoreductase subunit A
MNDLYHFISLLIFLAMGFLFPIAPVVVSILITKLLGISKPGEIKNSIYECGEESKGDSWLRVKADYYVYGLLFLVMDVEALFLLPFAVSFLSLSFELCLAILLFIFLLLESLVWAWKKGVLKWV